MDAEILMKSGDRVRRPRLLCRAGVPRPSLRGRRAVGPGPISLGPRPRSVESRRDPSAPTPLRGSGVHEQVVAYLVTKAQTVAADCILGHDSPIPAPETVMPLATVLSLAEITPESSRLA